MAIPSSSMAMSPSSPQQPVLSKRDKRRKNIMEKLADMVSTFSKDQNSHYRAQLHAIQVDMTLILRADPYENAPLDDRPQHIEELIEALTGGHVPGEKAAKEDFHALAGRRYYEYCQEINSAQEKRDADLTLLKNHYDNSMVELERLNSYKIQVAQREHVELAATIRQRLINTVTRKRDRLLREKEQLDIADSNSLLLHPSHYTMNVPSSPGGLHSNRKTRHTRNRMGDPEETSLERGRKRKAGDEDGNESPLPGFRPLTQDGSGGASPFQEQKSKMLRTQQEAPAYSIDSIFTEKELAHATTAAQFATHHFFHNPQTGDQNAPAAAAHANGKVPAVDGAEANTDALGALAGLAESAERQPSPPPLSQPEATGMERQVSNYATRGATRANPLSALSDAALAMSTTDAVINPFLPVMIPITRTDKGAPTPPMASQRDIQQDLAIMTGREDMAVPASYLARPPTSDGPGQDSELTVAEARDIFLEQACSQPTASQPFRIPPTDLGPAMIKGGVNRTAFTGFADPASMPNGIREGVPNHSVTAGAGFASFAAAFGGGGVSMSRATSMGGSEMGAGEMGGTGMRRTRSRAV